jgi:hypothetical protein
MTSLGYRDVRATETPVLTARHVCGRCGGPLLPIHLARTRFGIAAMATMNGFTRRASLMPPENCCGASCKEDCRTPPCPCNMDHWSLYELRELEMCDRISEAFKRPAKIVYPKRGGAA